MEKILRYTLLGGVFLVPFIPFIVANGMFFPFIVGKNFAFRILVEVLLASWVMLAYFNSAYRPQRSRLLWAMTGFVGIVALADVFSENPYKSFWSNYERMEGFVGLLHLYAYFLVAIAVLHTEKLWDRFWNVSLGASVLMGIFGLFQLGGALEINQGGTRVDGTLGNAAYYAVYTLVHIFIAAFLALKQKRQTWQIALYASAGALNLVMLYYTATRGAILGLIGGVLLTTLLIALFEKDRTVLRKGAIGILAGVVLLLGGFFAAKDTTFVKESPVLSRFASISLEEATTKSRFLVWDMAWQGFKERPMLGWGQESFNFVFNKYYDPQMYAQEPWFDRAHNVFLDWLVAGGIFALLAYLSLFGIALYLLWFRTGVSVAGKSILTGLFAAYFFHNLFVFDHLISYILFFSLLAYIHTLSTEESVWDILIRKMKATIAFLFGGKTGNFLIAPLVLVALIFSLYFFNYKGMAANFALLQGLSPQEEGLSKNLEYFNKALSYKSLGGQEIRETLFRVVGMVDQVEDAEAFHQQFVSLTDEEWRKQIELVPNDLRFRLLYASFLNGDGRYDDALAQLEKAVELSPRKQAVYFEIAIAYLNKKEYAQALEAARAALELAPEYENARNMYAMVAIYAGDIALADELLVSARGTVNVDDNRILQAYADMGYHDRVVQTWLSRVEKNPNDFQLQLSLAGAYLNNGQRQRAIATIQGIIDAVPEFKEQGEYYISEIRAGRNP